MWNSMINNAGTGGLDTAGKIHEMTEKTWDNTMYTHFPFTSTTRLSKHSLKYQLGT